MTRLLLSRREVHIDIMFQGFPFSYFTIFMSIIWVDSIQYQDKLFGSRPVLPFQRAFLCRVVYCYSCLIKFSRAVYYGVELFYLPSATTWWRWFSNFHDAYICVAQRFDQDTFRHHLMDSREAPVLLFNGMRQPILSTQE